MAIPTNRQRGSIVYEPSTQLELQAELQDYEATIIMPTDRAYRLPTLLRPYQWGTPTNTVGAVEFLQASGRCMCTFQPGLGKTEAAIMACLDPTPNPQPYTRTNGPTIIVAPSNLTDMWYDRILEWLPDAPVVLASGTRAARARVLKYNADWYIINYEMLASRPARDINKLPNIPRLSNGEPDMVALDYLKRTSPRSYKALISLPDFELPQPYNVIFDESHHLKNPDGKQAQAAADLVASPDINVFMLSGTPIKRDPDDLYMQLHILYPSMGFNRQHPELMFNSYHEFVKQYCVVLPNPYRSSYDIRGARKTRIEHLMGQVAYYTSYEEAEIYRPEVEPTPIRFAMDAHHADAYKQISTYYAYEDIKMHSAIEVMHALRAATCCPPKVENAVALAQQFDKAVFYTYYQSSARMLAAAIGKATNRDVPMIDGTVLQAERDRILEARPNHLVATVGTLSEGKDLSYMQAVVFFEEVWTPAELEQCTDRVRRFGNKESKVFVYFLMAKGTIDETIHAVAQHRGATAEAIVRKVLDKTRKQILKAGRDGTATATSA